MKGRIPISRMRACEKLDRDTFNRAHMFQIVYKSKSDKTRILYIQVSHVYIEVSHVYVQVSHVYVQVSHVYVQVSHVYIEVSHVYIEVSHVYNYWRMTEQGASFPPLLRTPTSRP